MTGSDPFSHGCVSMAVTKRRSLISIGLVISSGNWFNRTNES